MSNNLTNFLLGGTRRRELRDNRREWKKTQVLWRASPASKCDLTSLAADLVKKAMTGAERTPATPILLALCDVAEELLDAECINDIEVLWDVVESDVDAAVQFREMVKHRRRWAKNFKSMYEFASGPLEALFKDFVQALPESCFATWDDEHDAFGVPLVDLLADPAQTIEEILKFPQTTNVLALDLFPNFRYVTGQNLLVASGFPPTDDPRERQEKFVMPTRQNKKSSAELVDFYLAGTPFAALMNLPIPFNVPENLRFEHCHIVGGTGHGKTQLMQKMIHADLVAAQKDGRSVVVIDSQGDLINKLVRLDLFSPEKPGSLADRLILIDPADVEHPASLNLFDTHLERFSSCDPGDRERVFNGVIELYELFFTSFLGAELTQRQGVIFKYIARLMLQIPGATIHTLMEVMQNGKVFKPYMEQLDGSARYFFEKEFFDPSFSATKKQIVKRLWGVLSTPAFERMFLQPTNKLDLFEALNDGKIILMSTAKELLKRDGSQLLGRFMIAMLAQAALERSILPEYRRNPAFIYVDEAHEYFDDSIETILNQARKYRLGLTLSHQILDQLSLRLRSTLLANTSTKCVGGVSVKDAKVLAEELHTTPEFIANMRRRGQRTEFAVWMKHLTHHAVRLSIPLGFLERQPTLTEEEYDALIARNRSLYCGTIADIAAAFPVSTTVDTIVKEETTTVEQQETIDEARTESPHTARAKITHTAELSGGDAAVPETSTELHHARAERHAYEERTLGKGGQKHRYLQALVKELAEQVGLKATIEAPLANGNGQVDVLIERERVLAAVEISVTTPIEYEKDNLRKCLAAGYPNIAVVLAKSKTVQTSYRTALFETLAENEREHVSFLTPEEIPDYIASLAPTPQPTERIVKGYRVQGSFTATTPEETRARREAVGRLIAKSLTGQKE